MVVLNLEIGTKSFLIANIYGYNEDKQDYYVSLLDKLNGKDAENIIIGGDFNFVLNNKMDSKNRIPSHPKCREVLQNIMGELDLIDIWRVRNPDAQKFTWHSKRMKGVNREKVMVFSRLDWFLINNGLATSIEECSINPSLKTDHSVIKLKIILDDYKRGPGSWKLNILHLSNDTFVKEIKQIILNAQQNASLLSDPHEKWEYTKSRIVKHCKDFSKTVARSKKARICELNNLIATLKDTLVQDPDNEHVTTSIGSLEIEIDKLMQEKINSSVFRSKAQYVKDGETNSKYFFGLEKRKYFSRNMRAVQNLKGDIIKEQVRILDEQRDFYETLYTADKNVIFDLQPEDGERVLTNEERETLEGPISEQEITKVLLAMKDNKCPGLDGLPKEFYAKFIDILAPQLKEVYEYSFKIRRLNYSARCGLISLIPKKEKNALLLKSWRALTILNLDFKILSKLMAERMKGVLPEIISEEQCGFMKGRLISSVIRRTFEVIKYCEKRKIPALILTLDFEKCFDKIEHQAIIGALDYFNFGPNFKQWVSILFKDLMVRTQNFGFLSSIIYKTRGCNQGCNISPFCFLICGEVMLRKLKSNPKIEGIEMENGMKNLIAQFADDTTLFIKFDHVSLEEVTKTLSYIEAQTGLSINYDKTQIYRIGSITNTDAMLYTQKKYKWVNEPFNMLGITVGDTEENLDNYSQVIEKMEQVLKIWYFRRLTLMGRVLIVNTLCESLFVYKLSVTCNVSEPQIRKITRILDDFLWKGKKAKIAKETLYQGKTKGGLRLFNIQFKQEALKIEWIKTIQRNNFFRNCLFREVGLPDTKFILDCNLSKRDCVKYCNPQSFWGQVMIAWYKYTYEKPESSINVRDQPIWFNTNIKLKGQILHYKHWVSRGIVYIRDLLDHTKTNGFKSLVDLPENINWLEYQSIRDAISAKYGKFIKNTVQNDSINRRSRVEANFKIANIVYKDMITEGDVLLRYAWRWIEKFGIDIDTEIYAKCFVNLYKITKYVKLRDFQYRLLLGKIPTNMDLVEWNMSDDAYCSFCKKSIENIFHLLWECKFTKRIWNELYRWLDCTNLLTKENILYNNFHKKPSHISNLLGLILKQYIYRCRCQKKIPTITNYSKEVQLMYNIEKYNSTKTNHKSQTINTWKPVTMNQFSKIIV